MHRKHRKGRNACGLDPARNRDVVVDPGIRRAGVQRYVAIARGNHQRRLFGVPSAREVVGHIAEPALCAEMKSRGFRGVESSM